MTVWRKASGSGPHGGDCVEVASLAGSIEVRDSKNAKGARLALSPANWRTLTRQIKNGDLDLG
ncbi:DUF397 domain-containing protein [Spirillospora sp. CA-294931]|uniref:DUF397 domain-containing protein n=1 Tax=Spirillospora sp. CA-294931 TaxID=3240042 RepID=UPI003D9139FE